MKNETIERYLDECRITSGPWASCNSYVPYVGCLTGIVATEIRPDDVNILAASREMLKALIESVMKAEELNSVLDEYDKEMLKEIYQKDNRIKAIESALPGRTWPEIKSRLEEIEEEEK